MSQRSKRIPCERQIQLITECRSSGLSDYQWCVEHNIKPGTFYNWIRRIKKAACYNLPDRTGKNGYREFNAPEIVKLDLFKEQHGAVSETSAFHVESDHVKLISAPSIQISVGNTFIQLSNTASPELLKVILQQIGGTLC